MRVLVAAVLMFGLGGCENAAESAEKQLAIVEKSGNPRQICDAHRKVADAWLKQQDQQRYERADISAKISCRRAAQQGY